MNGSRSVDDAGLHAHLTAIARHDLTTAHEVVPDTESIPRFLDLLEHHRLVGVAARCYEEGVLRLENASAAVLTARHDALVAQTLRVELVAIRVKEILDVGLVDHRLLKGPALAHTVAVDPADREFRDVDMLVRADHVDSAVAALLDAGALRSRPQLRPGFDARFAKSVTMRFEGVEVDLHRVLDPGPFGVRMFPADLFVVPQRIRIAGREFLSLDRTDHLLHACYHVALGQLDPALTNLRDVALLTRGDWDVDRFDRTVLRWNGRPVIARAVSLLRSELGWEPPPTLGAFRSELHDAELLAPYVRDGDRFPGLAAATFRALPWADRFAYARAVGLPVGTQPLERLRHLADRSSSRHR